MLTRLCIPASIATCAALLAGCGGSSTSATRHPPGQPSATSSPTATTGGPLPSYVAGRLDIGNKPCAVEGGFGSVWVSVYGDNTLIRIDPSTHKVLARIKTGVAPCGIAVGGGSVWVENYGGDSVTRVDPRRNTVAATIKTGIQPYDVTFSAGAAWVTNFHDDTVTRIDATSGKRRTIKVGGDPTGIAPAGGYVWATNQADGTISRIDPATLKVRTTDTKDSPSWTAWGGGRLWIANGSSMLQIDPASGRVGRRVDLGAPANDGDIVGGTVWVPDGNGDLVGVGANGKVIGHWPLNMTVPFVVAGWAGKLWVVDFKGTAVEAIDPTQLTR